MDQQRKIRLSTRLAVFFGLGLLIWLPAVLLIGAPDRIGPWLPLFSYVSASIALYPAYWFAGLCLSRYCAKRDRPLWMVLLSGLIPLASGLGIPGGLMVAADYWQEHVRALQSASFTAKLGQPVVYYLGEQRFAIENQFDYFLPPTGDWPKRESAWIIDLATDKPDREGVIYLDGEHLDPEFFRHHDRHELPGLVFSLRGKPFPLDTRGLEYRNRPDHNQAATWLTGPWWGEICFKVKGDRHAKDSKATTENEHRPWVVAIPGDPADRRFWRLSPRLSWRRRDKP